MPTQVLDPNVAYLLLVAGMTMGILALFSPGTGLLEIGAVFSLVLAGIAITNLEINFWALIILVLGVFPFVLAIRKKQHWVFLFISIAALILGSVFLFRSPDGNLAVHPALAAVTSVFTITLLWFIGRKGLEAIELKQVFNMSDLVGKIGEARTNIRDEGTIYVSGEEWTARSKVQIPLGSKVRVIGRDGLTLIVEPLQSESLSG